MGCERVIRQAVALGAEVEHGLTGLEENLYLPPLAVYRDNLFLRERHVSTDERNPVLPVVAVPHAYDPRRDDSLSALKYAHGD